MVKILCMTVLRSCMEINVAELASMFDGVMFPNMEV